MPSIGVNDDSDTESNYSKVLQYSEPSTPKPPTVGRSSVVDDTTYHGVDSITVCQLFERQRDSFVKQIFPQFFVKDLLRSKVFDTNDLKEFEEDCLKLGDDTDPMIRDGLQEEQSGFIQKKLCTKIMARPAVIGTIVQVMRPWYTDMANQLEQLLAVERRKLTIMDTFTDSATTTPTIITNNNNDNNSLLPFPIKVGEGHDNNNNNSNNNNCWSTTGLPIKRADILVNIPDTISYFVEREVKQNEIVTHLKQLAMKGKGWLVLHGMGGSGKSILAANSVRQVSQIFNNGIFWLNIGQLNTGPGNVLDLSLLLLKFELLSESIGYLYQKKNEKKLDDLSLGVLRFCEHFKKYPRSLLVLDDVWSEEVIRHFQFNIPILVTTRVTDTIPKSLCNIRLVSMQHGGQDHILTMDESVKLLKRCLSTSPSDDEQMNDLYQNDYIGQIVQQFSGLPFCIPHIANYIRPFYEEVKQLDQHREYMMKRWKELHDSIITDSNQTSFNQAVQCLMEKSISQLEPDLVTYLYDFVIFFENVPFSVLCVLWNLDDLQTMNILNKLISKSLVSKHFSIKPSVGGDDRDYSQSTISNSDPIQRVYGIHSLTKSFLEQRLDYDDIKCRHNRLITNYLSKIERPPNRNTEYEPCPYDFSELPNDHYIYQHLSNHLDCSGRGDLFPVIFLDLCFIRNKIDFVGPSDVLSEYSYYERYFDGHQVKLKEYQQFIASNSSQLSEPDIDFVQIALYEPETSLVYRDVRGSLRHFGQQLGDNLFYFEWSNKNNSSIEQPPKVISFRVQPEVRHAALSFDSRFVCSVSGIQLQLWDASTGEILENLTHAHTAEINHCVFSRDGKLMLTTSDDGVAKLWTTLLYEQQPKSRSNSANLPISAMIYDQIDSKVDRRMMSEPPPPPPPEPNGGNSFSTRRRRSSGNQRSHLKVFDYNVIKSTSSLDCSNSLRCGDISDDGRFVIVGNSNGSVDLWQVSTAKRLLTMKCPINNNNSKNRAPIMCCSFSRDSRFVLALAENVCFVHSISFQQLNQQPAGGGVGGAGKSILFKFKFTSKKEDVVKSGPHSPVPVGVDLCAMITHRLMAYNAVFDFSSHSSNNNSNCPSIFTSSDKFIYEWQPKRLPKFFSDTSVDILSDDNVNASKNGPKCCYSLRDNRGQQLLNYCTVSASGQRIAGLETTRNEIILWNRGTTIPFCTLRCQFTNLTSLCFGLETERLLACDQSGEITVWEIDKDYSVTSIVDLKNDFATLSYDNRRIWNKFRQLRLFGHHHQNNQKNQPEVPSRNGNGTVCRSHSLSNSNLNPNLNVLTIDTKGFLRLFKGYSGKEDKVFSVELKNRFKEFLQISTTKVDNETEVLVTIDFPINITSCDICAQGYIAIGTEQGDVFLYDISVNGQFKLYTTDSHRPSINEPVFNCKFVPKIDDQTSTSCQFVVLTKSSIYFFEFDPISSKLQLIKEKTLILDEFIKLVNPSYTANNSTNVSISGFTFVPKASFVVFWTDTGMIFAVDCFKTVTQQSPMGLENILIDFWNLKARISSYDINVDNGPGQTWMIFATCNRCINLFNIIPTSPGEQRRRQLETTDVPRCCRLSRTMEYFVIGYDSGHIALVSKLVKVWSRLAHSNWVYDLVISPDDSYILSASDSIKLWNINGDLLQTFVTVGIVRRLFVNFSRVHNGMNEEQNLDVTTTTTTTAVAVVQQDNHDDSSSSSSSSSSKSLMSTSIEDDKSEDASLPDQIRAIKLTDNSDENNNNQRCNSRGSGQSSDSNEDQSINFTLVTVTDSSSLYILRPFNLKNSNGN